jgi:hypothetical protein
MDERARTLIEELLKELPFRRKGELAVYWVHICKFDRAEVARALYLDPKTTALRVTMSRAFSAYPCGRVPGRCDHMPGCAHMRGEQLWIDILRRAASQF